jgi:hypothetical protein
MRVWHRGRDPKTPKENFNHIYHQFEILLVDIMEFQSEVANSIQDAQLPYVESKIGYGFLYGLANFIHEHNNEDSNFVHFDHHPHFISTIPKRYNR